MNLFKRDMSEDEGVGSVKYDDCHITEDPGCVTNRHVAAKNANNVLIMINIPNSEPDSDDLDLNICC